MLVLNRKVGEKLVIGDGIVLTVVSIDRGKVRLGVDAPKSIPVDRYEIHESKMDSLKRAEMGQG